MITYIREVGEKWKNKLKEYSDAAKKSGAMIRLDTSTPTEIDIDGLALIDTGACIPMFQDDYPHWAKEIVFMKRQYLLLKEDIISGPITVWESDKSIDEAVSISNLADDKSILPSPIIAYIDLRQYKTNSSLI